LCYVGELLSGKEGKAGKALEPIKPSVGCARLKDAA
jgi:hypothetical protein